MNKSVSSFKNIIVNAKNMNDSMKFLNLDINTYFLCLLKILEDTIIDYHDGEDYSYLLNVANYLQKTYLKLGREAKRFYRRKIGILRKVYKIQLNSLIKNNRKYFEQIYICLNLLLVNNKKDKICDFSDSDGIDYWYDFLYEIIFHFQSLEYLDKIIKENPKILNSKKNEIPIFQEVIEEYIHQIVMNDDKLIAYYERVINKFLLEEAFALTNQMQDIIIKTLSTFVKNNKKITKERVLIIKQIIESITTRKGLFAFFNIKKDEKELSDFEFENLRLGVLKKHDRGMVSGYTMTIDDIHSDVLDDAISSIKVLENGNLLYMVHIADPLMVIPYKSDIMLEARKQTSTIYGENFKIDMFPSTLSVDKLSLAAGKNRYTKTFCIEFDRKFNIIDFYFLNTIVNVSERLSYDSLNELYRLGGRNKQETKSLQYFDNLVSALQKMFHNAKSYEEVKPKSAIGNLQELNSFSEKLVSYSMILVSHLVSRYFYENNLPYLYRCHRIDANWIQLLDSYNENSNSNQYKNMIKRLKGNLPSSYYSGENHGHMGLGLSSYSHITSPLRRFADDLNMHALDVCYFKNPTDIDIYRLEREIKKTCDYLNMQNNTIDEYLSQKIKIK